MSMTSLTTRIEVDGHDVDLILLEELFGADILYMAPLGQTYHHLKLKPDTAKFLAPVLFYCKSVDLHEGIIRGYMPNARLVELANLPFESWI